MKKAFFVLFILFTPCFFSCENSILTEDDSWFSEKICSETSMDSIQIIKEGDEIFIILENEIEKKKLDFPEAIQPLSFVGSISIPYVCFVAKDNKNNIVEYVVDSVGNAKKKILASLNAGDWQISDCWWASAPGGMFFISVIKNGNLSAEAKTILYRLSDKKIKEFLVYSNSELLEKVWMTNQDFDLMTSAFVVRILKKYGHQERYEGKF